MKKIYKAIIVAFALLVLIPLIFFMILFGINLSTVHLDTSMLNSYNSKITLYDRDSTPIIQTSPTGQNTVNLNELPQYVIDAFIATEDKRFYEHNGINIGRIIKATFTNIINGYAKEGASTITQQLIKNTHLSSEKTLDRKVKEILLALQLEKEYTKDEILSTYFNILYFGHNIYGLQDASTIYFGHDATELTLWESATLAGIIKSPASYSPINNPENCQNRRNLVLSLMLKQSKITQDEFNNAIQKPLKIANYDTKSESLYYKMVRDEALKLLNISEKELSTSGLKVYTYLNKNLQDKLTSIHSELKLTTSQNDIIMIADNKANSIIACVGNKEDSKRQCGSLIKPILCYASAFENNILTPASHILDDEIDYNGYSPKNANGKFNGWVTVRNALTQSLNIPAVKTLEYVGIDNAKKFAKQFGLEFTPDDNHLALALGAMEQGTTVKQICDAFTTFANNGYYYPSVFISKIEDFSGKVLYSRATEKQEQKACRDDTAFLINNILQDCTQKGTAKKLASLNLPIASKTGTVGSENGKNTDAWCVSYCPEYTITSWCGNVSGESENDLPKTQNGGTICAKINYDILSNLKQTNTISNFKKPDSVISAWIDKDILEKQHKVIVNDKSNGIKEYFSKYNLPKENKNLKTNNIFEINYDSKDESITWAYNNKNSYTVVYTDMGNISHSSKEFLTSNNIAKFKINKHNVKSFYVICTTNNGDIIKSNEIKTFDTKKSELPLRKKLAKLWFH